MNTEYVSYCSNHLYYPVQEFLVDLARKKYLPRWQPSLLGGDLRIVQGDSCDYSVYMLQQALFQMVLSYV